MFFFPPVLYTDKNPCWFPPPINKDSDENTIHPCDQPRAVKLAPEISASVSLADVFGLIGILIKDPCSFVM